jgi:hypothetical protein
MSKRACPTICPEEHKRMCFPRPVVSEAEAVCTELKYWQDARDAGRISYDDCAERMDELNERAYRTLHKLQWSRIEAGFGICVDDNGADEFYVYVGLHEGYRFREEKWRTFKMADWAVHTNYPRDPLDFEDF